MATETIAAVDRTSAFDQQKRTVAVFVQQTRHHTVLLFQRIGAKAGRGNKLLFAQLKPGIIMGRSGCLSPCVQQTLAARARQKVDAHHVLQTTLGV